MSGAGRRAAGGRAPLRPLRDSWRAAAAPAARFAGVAGRDARLGRPLLGALASSVIGGALAGWALARATSPQGVLPLVAIGAAVAAAASLVAWFLGGLALARLARLEARGWEVAALAQAPTGWLAASLVPAAALAPAAALLAGALLLPVAHLRVVRAGLRTLAPERAGRALTGYVLAAVALPLAAFAFSAWLQARAG